MPLVNLCTAECRECAYTHAVPVRVCVCLPHRHCLDIWFCLFDPLSLSLKTSLSLPFVVYLSLFLCRSLCLSCMALCRLLSFVLSPSLPLLISTCRHHVLHRSFVSHLHLLFLCVSSRAAFSLVAQSMCDSYALCRSPPPPALASRVVEVRRLEVVRTKPFDVKRLKAGAA